MLHADAGRIYPSKLHEVNMSADKDRAIRRQKQKRAKSSKKQAQQQPQQQAAALSPAARKAA